MSAALQKVVNAAPIRGKASSHPFDVGMLPSSVSQAIWRATEVGQPFQSVVTSGFADLDAHLPGGGWPCNCLSEILHPQPSLCEWRLLSPALAKLASCDVQVLLVGPPKRPHMPGLLKLGISDKNLVWIAADTPAERLWTTEQLVKANPRGGAILAWLPQARAEQLRRLQVHAQSCDCPIFLFRPEAARLDSSPAPLRLLTTLGIDWELHVRILKRRGALMDDTIVLPSIPATLASVFTPRLMSPSRIVSKPETTHVCALGSTSERRPQRRLVAH